MIGMNRANPGRARVPMALVATFFAAAVGFGANTIGTALVAIAEPNNSGTWDIEAYDACIKKLRPWESASQMVLDAILQSCCENSGGVWNGNTCVAPPGQPAGQTQVPPPRDTSGLPVDNPPVNPGPQAAPPRDPSRIPQDNAPINSGPSAPATTPVPGLS
jgi:hypothetical protein